MGKKQPEREENSAFERTFIYFPTLFIWKRAKGGGREGNALLSFGRSIDYAAHVDENFMGK